MKHIYFSPGPPEFTQELHMRQETDGVLLESFLIYEPGKTLELRKGIHFLNICILEHEATWFKEGKPLLGGLDYDERYQVKLFQ